MATATTSAGPAERSPTPPYAFGAPWPDLNDGLSYTDVVRSAHSGKTVIGFYSSIYKSSAPLQGWLQRIRNGQISIDGEVVTDPDTILRVGSEVVYHRLPWKEPYAPYLLKVLYEDDDMVAINKPSGLQVLPGGLFQQRTVLAQLHWKARRQNPSCFSSKKTIHESHPVPTHRLGRGTSGILLCAKTKLAKRCLAMYFATGTSVIEDNRNMRKPNMEQGNVRRILKFYRALVTGVLEPDEVVIKQPIGVMHYPGVAKGLYVASSSGKPALSKVCVLERDMQGNQTLVQVEIHSGRPHQIRIHLAYIGHPLLGDPLYDVGGCPKLFPSESVDDTSAEDGGYQKPVRPVPGDCGYFLHAYQLALCHPSTNEKYPKDEKWRVKGLEFASELDVIFGGTIATGDLAYAPSQDSYPFSSATEHMGTSPDYRRMPDSQGPDSVPETQQTNDDGHVEITPPPARRRTSIPEPSSSQRRKLSGPAKLGKQIDRLCDAVESRSTATSVRTHGEGITVADCIKLLDGMENMTKGSEIYLFAVTSFMKKEAREVFTALDGPKLRLMWLEHMMTRASTDGH